ncbi:MAG TPA: di-heme oxidoredictase family protein [Candidatus Angelobacter sp.]
MIKTVKFASVLTLALLFLAGMALAQTDPGVQSGNRGTGAPLASLNTTDGTLQFFQDGQTRFQSVEVVNNGTSNNVGLGPRFNSNSCVSCHSQPAIGGSGPAVNPQFQFTSNGVAPNDRTPFFITANGPTREARFPFFFNPDGSANTNNPNGGVEDLFTVSGRPDAGTCGLPQPSFNAARAANNLIFRIPTPTFGAGLIENLDDSTLLQNAANNNNNNFGISGALNHNGNDGTITRFGWKAQNKSLHIFAGEAYNVEMGISNLLFTQDRPLPGEDGNGGSGGTGLPANCLNLSGFGYPEDTNNPTATSNAAVPDDVSAFADFMRTLAPPPTGSVVLNGQTVSATSIANGQALFSAIGCATCHNPTPGSTQASNITGSLSNAPVNAFSDIEIHHMGTGLADNVGQGGAGGDQFRTAPLWGVGQRIFLLHDGRTTNLIKAIDAHDSNGSEADVVTDNFQSLSPSQKQDILNFLRSL